MTADKVKIWEEAAQKREQEQRERMRNIVWSELREARGKRYAKASFPNYIASTPKQKAAKAAVEEYSATVRERVEAGQSVLFIGPAGTGKDHLMFALAHSAIGAFKQLLWVSGTDLWLAFREAIDAKERPCRMPRYGEADFSASLPHNEGDIIRKLREVDVLCISDPVAPGASLTDWQADKLLAITDYRYSNLLPTWVTLNAASRAEAETRIGAPTVDRWAHGALVVVCDWPSYRQKQETEV